MGDFNVKVVGPLTGNVAHWREVTVLSRVSSLSDKEQAYLTNLRLCSDIVALVADRSVEEGAVETTLRRQHCKCRENLHETMVFVYL